MKRRLHASGTPGGLLGMGLETLAPRIFGAVGAFFMLLGIGFAFVDPAMLAIALFGLLAIGIAALLRRLLAVPAGMRRIALYERRFHIARPGAAPREVSFSQHIEVEDGADEPIARQSAIDADWRARADWVAGVLRDADGNRGQVYAGAVAVCLLLALVAAVLARSGASTFLAAALGGLALAWGLAFAFLLLRSRLRRRRFRDTHLRMHASPAFTGSMLRATLETGVDQAALPVVDFELQLRCTFRLASGNATDRHSAPRQGVLWQSAPLRLRGKPSSGRPRGTLAVEIELPLPADQPAATLAAGADRIEWELRASARLPGLDFGARFLLPVLAPDERPTPWEPA